MKTGTKVVVGIAGGCGLLVVGVIVLGLFGLSAMKTKIIDPEPGPMPAAVSSTMEELLSALENQLSEKAPKILAGLNPGLSDEKIRELEASAGITLDNDIRALYRWRNGQNSEAEECFVPYHVFHPLDEALKMRAELKAEGQKANGGGKFVYNTFLKHRETWLMVFDDTGGDGYYFDTARAEEPGNFFENYIEDSYYLFYPSIRNFIAELNESYETGAIHLDESLGTLDLDFDKYYDISLKYGGEHSPY